MNKLLISAILIMSMFIFIGAKPFSYEDINHTTYSEEEEKEYISSLGEYTYIENGYKLYRSNEFDEVDVFPSWEECVIIRYSIDGMNDFEIGVFETEDVKINFDNKQSTDNLADKYLAMKLCTDISNLPKYDYYISNLQ